MAVQRMASGALIGTAAGATAAPLRATPTITLSPTAGGEGTMVTVTGTGFPPNTRVAILEGAQNPIDEPMGSAAVEANGTFTYLARVSAGTAKGTLITTHDVRLIVHDAGGNELARAPFDFQPPAAAPGTPATGGPGALLPLLVGSTLLSAAGLLVWRAARS